MDKGIEVISTFLVALIGLATIAVLVGQNSQTSSVLSSFGSAISQMIAAATGSGSGGNFGGGGSGSGTASSIISGINPGGAPNIGALAML